MAELATGAETPAERAPAQDPPKGLDAADELRALLHDGHLTAAYQPLVDLDSGATVGYEALARGPVGTALASPVAMFDAAREAGLLADLDWACREAAVAGARAVGLRHPLSLFVNAEPDALKANATEADRWQSFSDLRCYTEVTERALTTHPADLLRTLDRVREQDWGIALDDIGATEASLALMPLIRPDVLKLDLRLLAARADVSTARVVHAVLTQAASTGATVVAEGIETERHLETARAYGVALGQGYLLGRPGPLPAELTFPTQSLPLVTRVIDRTVPPAPFALVNSQQPSRRLGRDAVLELARQLLAISPTLQPPPVVLMVLPSAEILTAAARTSLRYLAERLPLLVVLSPAVEGLGDALPGVRLQQLPDGDQARNDLDVIVITPYYAAALTSRPAATTAHWDDSAPGAFETVLTFDRAIAVGAANSLLARVHDTGAALPWPVPPEGS